MDPNANLARQRTILAELRDMDARIERAEARGEGTDMLEEEQLSLLSELADLAEALDGWLSKGGFLPAAWERASA